ncbi:chromosome segregation protein Spc25-domain-containing protein [Syncephalis fuscata]|nr:chromosome segregation protein Spc25-domain-containing protein [Syncephalis fuscata]
MDISSRYSEFSSMSLLRNDPRRSSSIHIGNSNNTATLPHITLPTATPSTTTVTPEIACDDLREQLSRFTAQLDQYVVHCKSSAQSQDNDWRSELKEQRGRIHQLEQEVATQMERHQQMTQALEKEKKETLVIKVAVQQLEQRQLTEAEHNNELNRSIETAERILQQRQQLIRDQERIMSIQREKNQLEQACYENILGLKIHSPEVDVIEFIFNLIDEQKPNRLFKFTLCVAQEQYEVLACEPQIDTLDSLVGQLNEYRHFYQFLKQMRMAFVQLARQLNGQ